MNINDKVISSENAYLMISEGEELSIMSELDLEIIVDEKPHPGYLWISFLEADAEEMDEIVLNRSQAKFLKAVLDQIL